MISFLNCSLGSLVPLMVPLVWFSWRLGHSLINRRVINVKINPDCDFPDSWGHAVLNEYVINVKTSTCLQFCGSGLSDFDMDIYELALTVISLVDGSSCSQ